MSNWTSTWRTRMCNNLRNGQGGKNVNKSKIYAEKPKDDNSGQKNCQNQIKEKTTERKTEL